MTVDLLVYERTDPRLGRFVAHDPRSRAYTLPAGAPPTKLTLWERVGPVHDQGATGSCVANASLGLLMTKPFSTGRTWTEAEARELYHEATVLDEAEIPGVYPPTDTGSAGNYGMKALQARGLITKYLHAFSLDAALNALNTGPIAVGTIWLQSMFSPDSAGMIRVNRRSTVAGGHEYVVDGYDPAKQAVRMTNSWGTGWGKSGSAWLSVADLAWLLAQRGDVVQPTVPVAPPPPPPPFGDANVVLVAAFEAWRKAVGA